MPQIPSSDNSESCIGRNSPGFRQCTQPRSPNQHQYRLAERAQGARALRRADPAPVSGRQPSEELHDVAWDVERGSIGDQGPG